MLVYDCLFKLGPNFWHRYLQQPYACTMMKYVSCLEQSSAMPQGANYEWSLLSFSFLLLKAAPFSTNNLAWARFNGRVLRIATH